MAVAKLEAVECILESPDKSMKTENLFIEEEMKYYFSEKNKVNTLNPQKGKIYGKIFSESQYLETYMLTHSKEKKNYECGNTYRHISYHNSEFHGRNRTEANTDSHHECCYCKKRFKSHIFLAQHLKMHMKPRKCKICGKIYSKLENFKVHMIMHGGGQQNMIGKRKIIEDTNLSNSSKKSNFIAEPALIFTNEKVAGLHSKNSAIESNTDFWHECCFCGMSFESPHFLTQHLRVHTTPQKCDVCGKMYEGPLQLKLHMLVHKGKNRKTYWDEIFQKVRNRRLLILKQKVAIPRTTVANEKNFQNDPHVRELIEGSADCRHRCCYCEKMFHSHLLLAQHLRTHTKPRKCEVCGKTFAKLQNLKDHMLIHTGKNIDARVLHNMSDSATDGISQECAGLNRFSTGTNIPIQKACELHGENHSTDSNNGRFHDCCLCAKKFTSPYLLAKHLREHTRQKKCKICGKIFRRPDYLKAHLLTHSGEKP
uniref:zinc finger protein 728-like n=1 Tax=Styela clava TaxID=7725 RepID=UPI0019393DB9|nr:zinc finger protein 728-like [Styela clava]